MIALSSGLRFYIYQKPVDMRKSIDGLHGIVQNEFSQDVFSGDIFVFINKSRDKMKILVWDRTGFWLFYKRLEQGRFQRLKDEHGKKVLELSYEQLVMILEGIDLGSIRRRKRYKK